ncbi:MAG: hypothetical protein HY888_01325 [Deltaproteobacteria bacterium]|nr:hypothetical protein [Deltaproteobacteria bacterium]
MSRQSCAICAWRQNCSKKFCIPDNGSRCPDFTRDVSIKDTAENDEKQTDQKDTLKK